MLSPTFLRVAVMAALMTGIFNVVCAEGKEDGGVEHYRSSGDWPSHGNIRRVRLASDRLTPDASYADRFTPDASYADRFMTDASYADRFMADASYADRLMADASYADRFMADRSSPDSDVADLSAVDEVMSDRSELDSDVADVSDVTADSSAADSTGRKKRYAPLEYYFSRNMEPRWYMGGDDDKQKQRQQPQENPFLKPIGGYGVGSTSGGQGAGHGNWGNGGRW